VQQGVLVLGNMKGDGKGMDGLGTPPKSS
jgi:hypothetical protein